MSLIRFWFEFDLDGHRPPAPAPGTRNIDGGTVQYQWLSWGAGVTARNEADALALLGDVVGAKLPPRLKTIHDVAVDRAALGLPDFLTVGDPSTWRLAASRQPTWVASAEVVRLGHGRSLSVLDRSGSYLLGPD